MHREDKETERNSLTESLKKVALMSVGAAFFLSLTESYFYWTIIPVSSLSRIVVNFTCYLVFFLITGSAIFALIVSVSGALFGRARMHSQENHMGALLVVGPLIAIIFLYFGTFHPFEKIEGYLKWILIAMIGLSCVLCFIFVDIWAKRKGRRNLLRTVGALQGASFLLINALRFASRRPENFLLNTYKGVPIILFFIAIWILTYIVLFYLIGAGQRLYTRKAFRIVVYPVFIVIIGWVMIALRSKESEVLHVVREGANSNPNVVLIVLDTARPDHFSLYGYDRLTTAFLDSLAVDAFVFEEAISPAPWTLPAHASIFTGLYPAAHGASWKMRNLDDEFVTMAEFLAASGYQTVGISNNAMVRKGNGLVQGFDTYAEMWRERIANPTLKDMVEWKVLEVREKWDGGAMRTNQWIFDWFRSIYDDTKPFFLFVNYMELHQGFQSPGAYRKSFITLDVGQKLESIDSFDLYSIIAGELQVSEQEYEILRDLYDGDLLYLDTRVGELVRFLELSGLLKNTLLVITSDHGENLGEHGMIDHQLNLFDTLLRVPLVVKFPSMMDSIEMNPGQVQTLDIFPTVMTLLGADPDSFPFPIQGRSLIRGNDKGKERAYTISEYKPPSSQIQYYQEKYPMVDLTIYDREIWSIRTDSLKYIGYSRGPGELFDISRDPNEETDLAGERTDMAKKLENTYRQWFGSFSPAVNVEDEGEIDEETLKVLKALGYVN
jgi:arylsulfatase A-like enzyme